MYQTARKIGVYGGRATTSILLLAFSLLWFSNGPTPTTLMIGTLGLLSLGIAMGVDKWLNR